MSTIWTGPVNQLRMHKPRDREQLALWMQVFLKLKMPRRSVCECHATPLDYLAHSFFEEEGDALVWACRGGGKTTIGAAATLLDLLFKPGIEVRILGGSLEQSEKMYSTLMNLVGDIFADQLEGKPTQRRLCFTNGSRVEILAQSDRSVRGQRVQKLRCDEVELFEPSVWQAAQLTTRSEGEARGKVEAFSTMHRPGGLMQNVLEQAEKEGSTTGKRLFSWCLWDVIERCPPERECARCPLWKDCGGRAKEASGFLHIDDAIAMQGRVSRGTWAHEMLCERPVFEDGVFGAFQKETHVVDLRGAVPSVGERHVLGGQSFTVKEIIGGVDYGYRHAFVCLWIVVLQDGSGKRALWVIDEMVTKEKTVAWNAEAMRAWRGGTLKPRVVYADVAGKHRNSQTGSTDEEVMKAAGFVVNSRGMEIMEGVAGIGELLAPAAGGARFFVDPRCVRLLAALEGYRYGAKGEPVKDGVHDHLIDALRYAVMGKPQAHTTIFVDGNTGIRRVMSGSS